MRITAGLWRGRKLFAPEGLATRPTADKVRQAVFNILAGYSLPVDAAVLDGFCGTGALGLEALSRGARACVFIDQARESIDVCRRNIVACQAGEAAQLLQRDLRVLDRPPAGVTPAALFFLDPPYRQNLIVPALEKLAAGWLAPNAIGVVECEKETKPVWPTGFQQLDDRIYGQTRILLLRYGG